MLNLADFKTNDRTSLDAEYFSRRFKLIVEATRDIDKRLNELAGSEEALVAVGIARINEALLPAISRIQSASSGGLLAATSTTEISLTQSAEVLFFLTDNGALDIFSPTPFMTITRSAEDAADDYAVVRLNSYDPATGGLLVDVISVSDSLNGVPQSDWSISASGGLAVEILEVAAQVALSLATSQQAASDAADAAQIAEDVLANGPVVSVNGMTGTVVLGQANISGLVAALAGKAASSHGHGSADVIDGGTF